MRKGRVIIGWREWLALPELHVDRIKAKVDTGARTSALHAEELEYVRVDGKTWVNFVVHPEQHSRKSRVIATALLLEQREVRSSNGKEEVRPVIETTVRLGALSWLIEVTLTRRDVMGFRMLLGRQAVRGHGLVDPGRSFLNGKTLLRASSARKQPIEGR